jgi:hypothetical protein
VRFVHSVYLIPQLATHQAVINGTKNRFKLRLRYYDDRPNTPVFFEVKTRGQCILKQRCGVKRDAVRCCWQGNCRAEHCFARARHWHCSDSIS